MKKPFILRYKEAQHLRCNFRYWVSHYFVGYFNEGIPVIFQLPIIYKILKEKIILEYQLFKFVFLGEK
ncbi:MAG: hypothetical protein AABY22_32965 [Nanoarchaeota archaeon]